MTAKTAPTIAFDVHEKRIQIGAHEITIQTGKVARQAGGSVMIRMRDTVALVTACAGAAKDIDFIPLTLDYQEKSYASGRIPGSFFRREGRPGVHEILRSRIIDRSLRPLFPDGWNYETQIVPTVVSSDPDVDPGILCLTGASFALMLSDIAFDTPVAGVRVGRVDGAYIANPTAAELEKSDVDIAVACSRDAIVMVEGGANFVEESVIVDALLFAHKSVQPLIDAMFEWREKIGKTRLPYNPPEKNAALEKRVAELCEKGLSEATLIAEKQARYEKYATTKAAMLEGLGEEFAEKTALAASYFESLKSRIMRERIVKDHRRIDGRGPADVRPISIEVGVLPRTHGSALFTRGETQSLVVVTLGTREDEQKIETLDGTTFKRFLLHYNFPPFSVGEVKRMGSPGRREIGHGALAERAVERVVPADTEFPYTIRVVSEITESNGSSSMATVCGASLAMYDAGVPTLSPVAGVAMGLIKEGSDIAILTDILGDEDHLGDMDFKVCGNDKGVSALQMDIKIAGVDREVLTRALSQARDARLHILSCMNDAISAPRGEMSPFAPRITVFYIKPDRIRDVIGPGGKIIRDLVARTGCAINLEDDGKVSIASSDQAKAAMARKLIEDLTQEAEVGKTYLGTVVKTTDFGAFVEILPGIEGLCHISELAPKRIERVTDIVQEGDEIVVKVLGIDRQGKIRLSRKEALADQQGAQD